MWFPALHGAPVPKRVQSTTAMPQTRPLRRGWPRYDHGPPPDRPQPACSRLAAVGGARLRQHAALPCAQRATAGSARLRTTIALPSAVSMASAAAAMLAVPAGMSASALQAAMGVRDIRVRTRHLRKGPCAREGPVRTVAGGAKDSEPWRRIVVPTCSRLSLECEEAPFTATVKQPAQQEHQRQTGRQDSTGEHAPLLRDCLAAAPAMPPRCASAQLSAESRISSAGTIAGSRGARGGLMNVVYGRGPFLPHHTPSYTQKLGRVGRSVRVSRKLNLCNRHYQKRKV